MYTYMYISFRGCIALGGFVGNGAASQERQGRAPTVPRHAGKRAQQQGREEAEREEDVRKPNVK